MSLQMIGNGNLPCVYIEKIFLDLNDNFLSLSCAITDFIDSKGNKAWSTEEFLKQEIFLNFLLMNTDPKNTFDETYSDIINSTNPENVWGFTKIKVEDLDTVREENLILYKKHFEIDKIPPNFLDSINIYAVCFISYDIKNVQNLSLPNVYQIFNGPLTIETIKETAEFKIDARVFQMNGELYQGPVVKNQNNDIVSGAVVDTNSKLLQRSSMNNSKLTIVPKLDRFLKRTFTPAEPNTFISSPLWSIKSLKNSDSNLIKAFFSASTKDLVPTYITQFNENPLVKYNWNNLSNNFSGGISLTTDNRFDKIRINHQTSDQIFFQVSGKIKKTTQTDLILTVQVNLNYDSSTTILSEAVGNVDLIKQKFLNSDTEENYTNFLTCFLKIIAINRVINLQELTAFKRSFQSSFSSKMDYKFKNGLVSLLSREFLSLKSRFNFEPYQNFIQKFFYKTDYDPDSYSKNTYPQYGQGFYINIDDFVKLLKKESQSGNGLLTGKQFLSPTKILNYDLIDEKNMSQKNPSDILINNPANLRSLKLITTGTNTNDWLNDHVPYILSEIYQKPSGGEYEIFERPAHFAEEQNLPVDWLPKVFLKYFYKTHNSPFTSRQKYYNYFISLFQNLNLEGIANNSTQITKYYYYAYAAIIHNILFNIKEIFYLSSSNGSTNLWTWGNITSDTILEFLNTPNQFLLIKLGLSNETKSKLSTLGFEEYLQASDTTAHPNHSKPQCEYFILSNESIGYEEYLSLEKTEQEIQNFVYNDKFFENISIVFSDIQNLPFTGNFEMFQTNFSYLFMDKTSNLNATSETEEGEY